MQVLETVRDTPSVYLIVDLDDQPLYAGASKRTQSRLKEHFIRHDSSVVADGLLDPFEALKIYIWYRDPAQHDAFKSAIAAYFAPRWNRTTPPPTGTVPDLPLDTADQIVHLIPPDALPSRRNQLARIEAKLFHLLRGVRKVQIAGATTATWEALETHAQELEELFRRSTPSQR